jgi:hypothetical protein
MYVCLDKSSSQELRGWLGRWTPTGLRHMSTHVSQAALYT